MGKKLFRFSKNQAPKEEKKGRDRMEKEAAALPEGSPSQQRMRELIKRNYSPEQVTVLETLEGQKEAAAKYQEDQQIAPQEIIGPESSSMLNIISEQTGLPIVSLKDYEHVDLKLRAMLSSEQALNLRAVPLEEKEDGRIVVAIADPSNPRITDDLRLVLGREIEPVIANEEEIDERIDRYYGLGDETMEKLLEEESENEESVGLGADDAQVDLTDVESIANSPPIIKLVSYLLLRAIGDRASDIHIEPFPNFIRVRMRIDGVLRELPSPPRQQLLAIVSRIKVLASMNISESRVPQDGRIRLSHENREVDMRVSTMPTVHGESVVMRVLDKQMMMIGIRQIGMLPEVLEDYLKLVKKPNGIVLVTGPTGCGKTTTLYATLVEVQDPGEKLITTEDPVEYELSGIQQVNINERVGLTFARCLRAILRQDPDRVLVGEIRDVETAQIAVQASLTGHLVFSTLHTNSAAATITRLLDMGVEPFLITSSLEAIIGQRLVRTICQNCKKPYEPNEEELLEFDLTPDQVAEEDITFYEGEGCDECGHTGYRGRIGIYELLPITDEIRDLVLERATTDEIHEMALRQGMVTMRKDGWIKICMGLTTMSEVGRQTPIEQSMSGGAEAPSLEGPEARDQLEAADQQQPTEDKDRQALPKPKLDQQTMGVENEQAMHAYKAGDAEKKKENNND